MLRLLLAALAALALVLPARAQGGGPWLDTFAVPGFQGPAAASPSGSADGGLYAMVRRGADVYVGGRFAGMDDMASANVARWDGARWRPLGGGVARRVNSLDAPATVRALAVAADGSVYVGGDFTHAVQPDGTRLLAPGIARWDGTRWYAVGGSLCGPFPGEVNALLFDAADTLVVGGHFNCVADAGGTTHDRYGVARWTGSTWERMGGFDGQVNVLTLSPAGDVVAAGHIAAALSPDDSPIPGPGVFEWDGTVWRLIAPAFSSTHVYALAFVGSDLYAGGGFGFLPGPGGGSVEVLNAARWDGAGWHALGRGVYGTVHALAPEGASLVVGGVLSAALQADGTEVRAGGLLRWSGTDWVADGYDVAGLYASSTPAVRALLREPPGALLVGGVFGSVRSPDGRRLPARGLVRREAGGWSAVSANGAPQGLGTTPAVTYALAPSACGALLVGGRFESAGPVVTGGFGAWEPGQWRAYSAPGDTGLEPIVHAVAPLDCVDGVERFVVGGQLGGMRQPDGTPITPDVTGAAYWDGTRWSRLSGGISGIAEVLLPDGDGLYIGGSFGQVYQSDGTPVAAGGLARWSPGTGWTSPGEIAGFVYTLAHAPDGALVVGGDFTQVRQAGGTWLPAPDVARWDGTAWHAFGGPSHRTGFPYVHALAHDGAGRLVIGGSFIEVENPDGALIPARNVAAWDGSTWAPLGAGLDGLIVAALAVDARGRLYAGGVRPEGSPPGPTLFVWEGATWAPLEGGPTDAVYTLTFDADGVLYVGGAFSEVGGMVSPGLGVWADPALTTTEPATPASEALVLTVTPNPVRGPAALRFALPAAADVRLAVYDALGREVAVVAEGWRAAGAHTAALDAAALPAGVYLARLTAGAQTAVRRLTVVR